MDRPRDISRAAAYVISGFFLGFIFGRSNTDLLSSLERFLMAIVGGGFIALLVWFERASQQRQSNNWEKTRSLGKWPFILSRYLLARAIVLLVILFLPIMIQLGATPPLLVALAFAAIIFCPLLTFIGYQEWAKNEREFLADPIIKAARARIAESQQQ